MVTCGRYASYWNAFLLFRRSQESHGKSCAIKFSKNINAVKSCSESPIHFVWNPTKSHNFMINFFLFGPFFTIVWFFFSVFDNSTRQLWYRTYGEHIALPGAMFRGLPPREGILSQLTKENIYSYCPVRWDYGNHKHLSFPEIKDVLRSILQSQNIAVKNK